MPQRRLRMQQKQVSSIWTTTKVVRVGYSPERGKEFPALAARVTWTLWVSGPKRSSAVRRNVRLSRVNRSPQQPVFVRHIATYRYISLHLLEQVLVGSRHRDGPRKPLQLHRHTTIAVALTRYDIANVDDGTAVHLPEVGGVQRAEQLG